MTKLVENDIVQIIYHDDNVVNNYGISEKVDIVTVRE